MGSRDELVEALLSLSAGARNDIKRVGNDQLHTPWDRRHERINELLELLEHEEELHNA